jgi:hypothetical protein
MSKTCKKCGHSFPRKIMIEGKIRNFNNRHYCLECSPWGQHGRCHLSKWQTIDGIKCKQCPSCKEFKPATSDVYYLRSSDKSPIGGCKKCQAQKAAIFKKNVVDYKGGRCRDCDGVFIAAVYEFHHLDPSQKDFMISDAMARTSARLYAELDKCVLLCANCHRIRHASESSE